MSFDVYLVPSSATPGGREARATTGRALTLCGARWGGSGEADIILSTGEEVEFYGADEENPGGMFALRSGLTPELGQIVFKVAEATNCFITAPLEPPRMLRTLGNAGTLDFGDSEDVDAPLVVDVANVDELISQLSDDVDRWEDDAATIGEAAPARGGDDPAINPGLLAPSTPSGSPSPASEGGADGEPLLPRSNGGGGPRRGGGGAGPHKPDRVTP